MSFDKAFKLYISFDKALSCKFILVGNFLFLFLIFIYLFYFIIIIAPKKLG